MIRALFLRQLRLLGGLFGVTFAGLVGFEFLALHVAEAFEKGPGLARLVAMLPQFMQDVVTSQVGPVSFAALVAAGFMHPVAFAATLGTIILAATVPAGERESGLLDLFLARPLSRERYLVASILLVVVLALVLPLALLLGARLALWHIEITDELPWTRYVPCALGLSTLLLGMGGVTLALAVETQRRGVAVARAIGLVLVLYLLEVSAKFWPALEDLAKLSPFHWFTPIPSAMDDVWPLADMGVLLALFVLATSWALLRFRGKDLS